jgi:drug/metabolite transporter (DMT)-like permease
MNTKINWIIEGILAGIIFLIIKSLIDLISQDFTFDGIWRTIIVFLIAGLGYGITMHYIRRKKKK